MKKIILVIILSISAIAFFSTAALRQGTAPVEARPRIALVIDDWGYNTRHLKRLFEIDRPLTIGVLPNLRYSTAIAEEAHKKGYEVILHLPLEPHSSKRLEKCTIFTWMDNGKILALFTQALNSVPHARGVSNHMGSKATEDKKLMATILKALKRNELFFFDSLSSPNSVGRDVCEDVGVKFAQRSIFLDNEEDSRYIRDRLDELVSRAHQNGSAIGVGHDRKTTLSVIKETIPELEAQGVELVYVSDLVK